MENCLNQNTISRISNPVNMLRLLSKCFLKFKWLCDSSALYALTSLRRAGGTGWSVSIAAENSSAHTQFRKGSRDDMAQRTEHLVLVADGCHHS